MNIAFIDPKGETKGWNAGLAYIAGALIERGHSVHVLDLNNTSWQAKERVRGLKAEIAGVSLKSSTVSSARAIVKDLRSNRYVKYVICGGAHVTASEGVCVGEYGFDAGFFGEAELSLAGYFDYLDGEKRIDEIGSVALFDRSSGTLRRFNHTAKNIGQLDVLPFPVYDVFDSFNGHIDDYPLVTSRGCPYQCIYCCVGKVSGKQWRARTVENIIQELENADKKYRIKRFNIIDDNFTLDMERAKNLCRELIKIGFDKEWSCPNGVRADRLDEELLELMKRSGCRSISIGVESGVEKVFNALKKGERLSDIERTISIAKKIGVAVNGFFIIGLPGSTYEDDVASMKYGRSLDLNEMLFNIINIYPGTELWDIVRNDNKVRFLRDWKDSFHFGSEVRPVFDTGDYPESARKKMFYISNLSQHHYMAVIGYSGNVVQKASKLVKAVWRYDRKNIAKHVGYIFSHMGKVLRYVRKT